MRRVVLLLGAVVTAIVTAGCVDPPRFFQPGPLGYQRHQAHRYDPYPSNTDGPNIAGGRPPSYRSPPPEPSRARWQTQGHP